MDTRSDQELVALIAEGNKPAFNLVMQRYLATVLNFCKRYLPHEAEDITQEVFIRLWNKTPIWEDKGFSVKAWLLRVSYNLCIDQLRKITPGSLEDELVERPETFTSSTEQLLSSRAQLQQQMLALNGLPERQRTAIMLCACNGLNHTQAAQILNVTVDALEALLARGRRQLKQLFNQAAG